MTDFLKIATKAVNDGTLVTVISLDKTKASGRVCHRKLFMKVNSYGITGPPFVFLPYLFDLWTKGIEFR